MRKYILAIFLLLSLILNTGFSFGQCTPTITGSGPYTATFTTTGTCNWTIPTNVCTIIIEAWGGGGGGGGAYNSGGDATGGGGGAGAYAKKTLTVTPGQTISITVGSGGSGGTTSGTNGSPGTISKATYNSVIVCQADFGRGGQTKTSDNAPGGAGGLVVNCIGEVAWAGGTGGAGRIGGSFDNGGGGGGGAGTSQAGGNGGSLYNVSSAPSGGTGYYSGNNGGKGSYSSGGGNSGSTGTAPGGGGGGGCEYTGSASGGAGAAGRIIITYSTGGCCTPPASVSLSGYTTPICYGTSPGTFTATPNGGTPTSYTYLWYNNSVSTGITTNIYNPGNLTANTDIYCAVSTGSGCVKNSPTQTITVNPLFVNQWISLNTNGASFCPGETRSITVRVKNLGCSSWTSGSGTNVNFSYWWNTQGQDSNPRILPFSGLAQGAEQDVTFNVTAPVTPGTYTLNFDMVREGVCWFRNNSGPGGCGPGNVLYTSSSLTVGSPIITTQPVSTTICENGNGSFSAATSAGAPTYQWYYGGSPSGPWAITDAVTGLSGHTTSTLSLTNIPLGYSGAYVKCDVTSGGCTTASNAALLTVTANVPASVTISPNPAGNVCYGTSVTFTATPVNGGPAPSYQWKVNGGNTGTNSSTFSTAALNNGDIVTCVMTSSICASGSPAASNAVTIAINPIPAITAQPANLTLCEGSNGNFVVVTSSGSPTFQWYYGGSPSGPWTITDAVPGLSGHTTSTLSLTSVPLGYTGAYVKCDITSAACTITSNSALLTVNALPAITVQPVSISRCSGESGSFNVTATGNGLTYQWRKGGANISGATSSTYTIASIVAGDAGNYDCVVSGSCPPSVTSNTAALTVTSGPAIASQPQNCTQNVGYNALFSVSATGATSFQWQVSTDNGSTYNNITSSGFSSYVTYANWTTSTLTVSINNVLANGYRFRCVVSNGSPACNVTTAGAILSIGCTGNTYSWSGYSAGQTFTGNSYTYTQNVMSAKITYNSVPAWNYGTPKYSKPDPAWGCNPDYAPTGLLIDVDWSSNTHYVTVDISFSVPACGPVSFYIYDINDNGSDAWRDCIEINATNYLNAHVTPTAVNCSGGVIQSTSGSTLTIKSEYLNSSCTCYGFTNAPNKITIGNSSDKIKTITIKYFSAIASKGNPARQYIDISDITTGTPPEVPLPIELIEFTGKCSEGKIKLEWATTSEKNNDYFTILRSTDANKWEDVATVPGSGNSNSTIYYSATDDHPLGNTSYYKLRQTDFDGKSETFQPITVSCNNAEGTPQVTYYPNPFTSDIAVDIEYLKTDKAFLTIYDVFGKKVFDKFINKNELLETNFTINLGNLPAGIYIACFTSEIYRNTSRLVKSN